MVIELKTLASVAAGSPAAPVAVTGVSSAPAGNARPPGGNLPPPVPVELPDLKQAVAALNQFLAESQRSFRFVLDESTGQTIVRITNPETGELVRQIPSEDVLAGARALRMAGSLLNARA